MDTLALEAELRDKNINPTAMRLLILNFLKQQKEAVALSDIECSFDLSDRVTIYRTLKTFEQKGLIHKIITSNSTLYALCFAACDENEHHDTHLHFICKQCHKTICLTHVSIPKIEIPDGFQLDDIEVTAKGICKTCLA